MRIAWARGVLAFVAVVAVLAVAGGALGAWQAIDHRVLALLQRDGHIEPADGLQVIDLAYPEALQLREQAATFRASIARVLLDLARWPVAPRVVVLDVWFSGSPDGIGPLIEALGVLRARGTRVLAAVNPGDRHGALADDPLRSHHRELYERAVDGYGHVALEHAFGVLKYERSLSFAVREQAIELGRRSLLALPVAALVPAADVDRLPASIVVPLGDDALLAARTVHVAESSGGGGGREASFTPGITHVVIGSLQADSDNALRRPGPYLIAWAMSDLLAGSASAARVPLNGPAITIAIAVLAGASAAALFGVAFSSLRTRVVPAHWPRLAVASAGLAFGAAAGVLLLLQMIVGGAGRVAPVALPGVAALVATLLAYRSAARWIAEARARADLAGVREERAIDYDVFVSYAHDPPEHKQWVTKEVLGALAALRHADGRPYRIFFDESSIAPGRRWKREIELALLGTRCFVPVCCDRYFDRPYCREEIELADQLRIEGRLDFVPVARALSAVPERYRRKLQWLDASREPAIGEKLASMVARAVERALP